VGPAPPLTAYAPRSRARSIASWNWASSKAALEAFADVYRGELKPFGVDFVMVQPGNMVTGGPAKTAAELEKVARSMTPEQRDLYGEAFDAFAAALNSMQDRGLPADAAAAKVIEAAEETPAPIRVPVGPDAEEILRLVDAWNQRTSRVVVAVNEDELSAERLAELRRALDLVPGGVPVSFELGLPGGTSAVFDLPRHRVCVSESLEHDLDGIFGRGATRCRVA